MASKPAHKNDQPVIFEVVQQAGNVNELVLKPISGAEAFRKYSLLLGPSLNKSGNLRGMVINAKMRYVYNLSGNVGNKLAVVSALINIYKELSRAQAVWNSNAPASDKFSHITMLTSAAVLRSVTSIVPTVASLAAMSVEGYAMLFSAVTGNRSGDAFAKELDAAQKQISEIHSRQWDGEVWYQVINGTVH